MPDTPPIIPETSPSPWAYQFPHEGLTSEEEKIAAQESFEEYWAPSHYYIDLADRLVKKPLFLMRNLSYRIEAKHERRIKMTVSLSDTMDAAGVQTQKSFPLYVLLARLVSPKPIAEFSAVYKFSRECILTGVDGVSQGQATFLLPDMERLASKAYSGSLAILFISFAGAQDSQFGIDSSKTPRGNIGGHCLWSKIPLESLYPSWQKYPMDLGYKANSVSLVEMQPCFIKLKSMSEEKCVAIQVPSNPLTSSSPQQVQVTISAEEVGPTEKPPYIYKASADEIPSSSILEQIRLSKGKVEFNYKYHNNKFQQTEVTKDFTCPLCVVICGSFKGLECHMLTHDFFNFEFWVNGESPAINVSINKTMINKYCQDARKHINKKDLDARQPYFFSTKKSRKQKSHVGNSRQGAHKTEDADSVKSEKSQLMSLEQVLADRDKVDAADSENRKMLDDFVDMTNDEKKMMDMWVSFVRRQRVLSDGRIPWACEAFSRQHGTLMLRTPQLLWSWKMYMVKLWSHGLLDVRTMNKCNVFFEQLAN